MSFEPTKNILCRYFLYGKCSRGLECQFSHDIQNKPSDICKFFQTGNCRYKNKCANKHVLLPKYQSKSMHVVSEPQDIEYIDPSNPFHQITIAMNNLQLSETQSDENFLNTSYEQAPAPLSTLRMCVFCNEYFESNPFYIYQDHITECQKLHLRKLKVDEYTIKSQKLQCSICLQEVLQHEIESDRNFGLLENCDHIFCLHCIRDWRKVKDSNLDNVKACPLCRVLSHFVIPSYYFPPNEEEKKRIVDEYKSALREKHCFYFQRGRMICPFSTSCFFRHEFPDGTLADESNLVMNSTGALQVYSPYIQDEVPIYEQYYPNEPQSSTSVNWNSFE